MSLQVILSLDLDIRWTKYFESLVRKAANDDAISTVRPFGFTDPYFEDFTLILSEFIIER